MTTVRDRPGFDLRLLQQPSWPKPRNQWLLFNYHIHSYDIFTAKGVGPVLIITFC
jgi:hypothetical protein